MSECETGDARHLWLDAGIPGLSVCDCGMYRRYDRDTAGYWYSLKEPKEEVN